MVAMQQDAISFIWLQPPIPPFQLTLVVPAAPEAPVDIRRGVR